MENYQIRSKVHPKQRVAVLLKEDYENGNLTYGTVDEILTKTDTHYRGIKVRIKPEEETEEEKEDAGAGPASEGLSGYDRARGDKIQHRPLHPWQPLSHGDDTEKLPAHDG